MSILWSLFCFYQFLSVSTCGKFSLLFLIKTGVKLSNAEIYLALRPGGAFLSTVLDLAKLEAALDSTNFLKSETRKLMWTPFKFNNGTDTNRGWCLRFLYSKSSNCKLKTFSNAN